MCNIENIDMIWMRYAILLACHANNIGEISIGAVLVRNGDLIGYGWNASVSSNDPSAHAEIMALRMGGRVINNYRLLGSVLYVTLEPCMMCIGAIIQARIYRLVCGAKSKKIRWTEWLKNILNHPLINHSVVLTVQVLEKECSKQLSDFFQNRRR